MLAARADHAQNSKLIIPHQKLKRNYRERGNRMIYIKRKRERLGKTMQQLADEVGVTLGAISQYERGLCMPGADKLPELAFALGCTIDDLFRVDDSIQEEVG